MKYLLWLAFLFSIPPTALASINPPVSGNGVETFVCDVRKNSDDYAVSGTLRDRLELFNAEADVTGGTTHEGACLHYIYFLDPMTITLKHPLEIKAIQSPTTDGKHMIGTYISGKRTNGKLLPVTIDAVKLTAKPGQCAFMIERGVIYNANKTIKYEGGLASFQQIRNLTVRVSSADRAVCDDEGKDLLNEVIPTGSARDPIKCPKGSLAKNCDFKNLEVIVDTSLLDEDGDGIIDKDNCPELANKDQADLDGDGIGDVCDTDADDDDIINSYDKCWLVVDNDGQGASLDADNDFLADLCLDAHLGDQDNDGYADKADLCPDTKTSFKTPSFPLCPKLSQDMDMDHDGIGDACDFNIDGDELINEKDPEPCKIQEEVVNTDDDNATDNATDGFDNGTDNGTIDKPEDQEGETETPDNESDDDNATIDDDDNATDDNNEAGSLGGGCRLKNKSPSRRGQAWIYWLVCGVMTLTLIGRKKYYE